MEIMMSNRGEFEEVGALAGQGPIAARPLIILGAAASAGLVAASALPLIGAERRWLRPLGLLLSDGLRSAGSAAGRAAKRELASLPLTGEAAATSVERIVGEAVAS